MDSVGIEPHYPACLVHLAEKSSFDLMITIIASVRDPELRAVPDPVRSSLAGV
jgi:hypothetical protein